MVLARELPIQLPLLLLVQVSVVEQLRHVLVQILVGELQLGDAVLVVQWDCRAIFDGLAEVVDADVVAEHFARLLFADLHQGRSREGDESGVWERVAHVLSEHVVLAPVRLIGDDDDVRASR